MISGVAVLRREGDRTATPEITGGRKGVLVAGFLVLQMGSTILGNLPDNVAGPLNQGNTTSLLYLLTRL